jgi:hypothetical protein
MQKEIEENIQGVEEEKTTIKKIMIDEITKVGRMPREQVESIFNNANIDDFAVEASILKNELDELTDEFEKMPEEQKKEGHVKYMKKRQEIKKEMIVLALDYFNKTKNEFNDTQEDKALRKKVLFSLETLMEYSGLCEDGAEKVPPAIKEMLKQDEPDYKFMRKLIEMGLTAEDNEWNRDLIYSLRRQKGGRIFERPKRRYNYREIESSYGSDATFSSTEQVIRSMSGTDFLYLKGEGLFALKMGPEYIEITDSDIKLDYFTRLYRDTESYPATAYSGPVNQTAFRELALDFAGEQGITEEQIKNNLKNYTPENYLKLFEKNRERYKIENLEKTQ